VIERGISDVQIIRARARLREVPGERESNQFGSEASRTLLGYVGEEVCADWLGVEIGDFYDFDFVHRGVRFDVKTISCTSKPRPHYLATVNSCEDGKQHRQDTDNYLFLRILRKERLVWIVGFISADLFFKIGRFVRKGERLFEGQPALKADATVLEISKLQNPTGLEA